jgi:hypothetical protein
VAGVDAADQHELLFQGLAGAVNADGSVPPNDASTVCEAFKAFISVVYFAKDLAVGGLEGGQDLIDALLEDFLGAKIGCERGKVMGPTLESTVFGGAVTVVVYDGVL